MPIAFANAVEVSNCLHAKPEYQRLLQMLLS